jgi:DNA-binding response OmpR family regulator
MIVSRDEQVVNLFSDVLGYMGIDVQHYSDESTAVSQVGSARFEALVLDFDTVAGMAFLIQSHS